MPLTVILKCHMVTLRLFFQTAMETLSLHLQAKLLINIYFFNNISSFTVAVLNLKEKTNNSLEIHLLRFTTSTAILPRMCWHTFSSANIAHWQFVTLFNWRHWSFWPACGLKSTGAVFFSSLLSKWMNSIACISLWNIWKGVESFYPCGSHRRFQASRFDPI